MEKYGPGFFSLLTLIFITLKLLGKINWPWIWVISPLWLPVAILLVLIGLIFGLAFILKKFNKDY